MASRHRPRRGPAGSSNILVTGDVGTTAGPQGGARPGASESGDLDAREFGVPQADIPGGLRHVVNPETTPAPTARKQLRPADEHKFHGVPPIDNGQYETPPGEQEGNRQPKADPERKYDDAVPVYVVEHPGEDRPRIKRLVTGGPRTLAAGETVRIADRDPYRSRLYVCKEGSTGGLRIGTLEEVQNGFGLAIPSTSLQTFLTQDELYASNSSTSVTTTVSWAADTDVEAAGA